MDDTPKLLRVEEAARVLRIGRSKAYQMARTGQLPGVLRIGASLRVSAKALDQFIDTEVGGPPKAAA